MNDKPSDPSVEPGASASQSDAPAPAPTPGTDGQKAPKLGGANAPAAAGGAPRLKGPAPGAATAAETPRAVSGQVSGFGTYARQPPRERITSTEVIAGALTLVWVIAVGTFFGLSGGSLSGSGALTAVMTLLAVFLPIAMIWVAALNARTVRDLRDEAHRLQAAVDSMRTAYVQSGQASALGMRPSADKNPDEIALAPRTAEAPLAPFASRRDHQRVIPSIDRKAALTVSPAAAADDQPRLALGTAPDEARRPVETFDFVRALNFPESVDDKEGFRALRAALEDRETARLIRAAQDVLTLLSEDGIYMDDLQPDRARPEIWRLFAQGQRGHAISGLGGVRDRSSLALTAGRMRADPVFRDAAHHFLRQFDKSLAAFEKIATDQDLANLAETRTARAFMLFGRVTGTFD